MMTDLLIRLFVKHAEEPEAPVVRERVGMLSGAVGLACNLFLFAAKYAAGTLSGSIAILGDAVNNLSDAASSVVTLIGFRMSNKKPDHAHPFGHGRVEYLAGLFVGVVILLFSIELGKSSVEKILAPEPVECSVWICAILIASIAVKLWMFFFHRTLGRKICSAALTAVSWDSLSDTAATSVVLIGIALSEWFGLQLDGYLGVLVALFILYAGITSIRDTLTPILGAPPNPKMAQEIERLVRSYDKVEGVHDLIIHDYGPGRSMVSLHAEVPQSIDILEIHGIINEIELKLAEVFGCETVIHMDPIATEDSLAAQTREKVSDLVRGIDPAITIHDFRMVMGHMGTELIFDAEVPHQFRLNDDQVAEAIQTAVRTMDERYRAVVKVDKPFYPKQDSGR